ncbi:MAG TPA: RNA polymerase sigma-70 factor [Gemmatimonadaceae bacterium]|nr:RNA polymerase sigma-70 factor [Gemmatimonadaceae bacterium]
MASSPNLVRVPMNDRELLAQLSSGEEAEAREAFDAIFRAWYAPLVRAADAVVRERAVAEELVQDVMLELWRRRERLDADGSPQAYLFQATRNRALNHLRHLRVAERGAAQAAAPEEARDPAAPALLVAEEMETAVRAAIGELTPRCREVFELSRVHGLRYTEIAATLGVSVKAVEAQMGKALKALRERLAPWLPSGDRL